MESQISLVLGSFIASVASSVPFLVISLFLSVDFGTSWVKLRRSITQTSQQSSTASGQSAEAGDGRGDGVLGVLEVKMGAVDQLPSIR